jgi:hypothetical protein
MEKSNKRGKIPQGDWPLIMTRYEAGETLASIARTYDCSPPAISYVVSKSRARQSSPDRSAAGPSGREAQLIKGVASELTASGSVDPSRLDAVPPHDVAERRAEVTSADSDIAAAPAIPQPGNAPLGNGHPHRTPRDADGFLRGGFAERGQPPSRVSAHMQAPGGPGNGQPASTGTGTRAAAPSPLSRNGADTRHKLHLSLGNGSPSNSVPPYDVSGDTLFPPSARPVADDSRSAQGQAGAHTARPPSATPSRPPEAGFSEVGPGPDPLPDRNGREAESGAVSRGKEGVGTFIDHQLRTRVDTDIAAFLAAFDAALTQDTQENRSALREATDRLLRVGARTRIELERLEARVPLTAHDRSGSDPAAWRYR